MAITLFTRGDSCREGESRPASDSGSTDFTGRAGRLATLLDFFGGTDRGRLAMISGDAGAGKTALAVSCADRLGQRFPDGRILADLRGSDGRALPASRLVTDLLRAVGVAGALPRVQVDRAAILRESVADRRLLFVLDDAVTQAQIVPVLSILRESSVLVTGRWRPLGMEPALYLGLEGPAAVAAGLPGHPDPDLWTLRRA